MKKTYVCDRQGLFFVPERCMAVVRALCWAGFLERVRTFISLLFVSKVCM